MGGFLKWGYPTTMGFSYYKWSFWGVKWGYPYFWKHPYTHTHIKLDPPQMGPINSSTKTPAVHNKQDHGNPQPSFLGDTTRILGGVKPSFFMVLGSKGSMCIQKTDQKPTKICIEKGGGLRKFMDAIQLVQDHKTWRFISSSTGILRMV